jgi:hypothetical protein
VKRLSFSDRVKPAVALAMTVAEFARRLPNRPAFAEKWDDALTEIVFHLSFKMRWESVRKS